MNDQLQNLSQLISQLSDLKPEEEEKLRDALQDLVRTFEILEFKLSRTEKVKRTTGILLEETIEELDEKRKAVEESKKALERSLEELRATQDQLIHAEKMASLGELTAGIAHEIQNPLNFVNNFSEVSKELIIEAREEMDAGEADEVLAILGDLKDNMDKINYHGHRASSIVRSMLDHSRVSTGERVETDINSLCDEYLRLAYHGMRARDRSFNADFALNLDPSIPRLKVAPQDIGRVLLNLINNAFQAVSARFSFHENEDYTPSVIVATKSMGDQIEISVADNGTGIPDDIKNKIFQPFFTTKPTGEGTGLGLSISYDIITKGHGGQMKVTTQSGKGTTFRVTIPTEPVN
jgi:signal transduction histidine kinase